MKKIADKYYNENTITVALIIIILAFPVLELICEALNHRYLLQESILQLAGEIILVFVLFKTATRYRIDFKMTDIIVMGLFVFAVIAIWTSLDTVQSLYGNPCYREDPSQYLGYFMIFFSATIVSKPENRKKILIALMIMLVLQVIPGFLQKFCVWPWKAFYSTNSWDCPPGVAYGLTQHSNFYGAIVVLAVGCFTALFCYDNNKKRSILWGVLGIASFFACLFSNARLAWVGCFGVFAAMLGINIYCTKKGIKTDFNWKKFIGITIVYAIIFVTMLMFDPILSQKWTRTKDELESEELERMGSTRGYIWKCGILALLKRPLLGMGLDNYRMSFTFNPDLYAIYQFKQDKGHSEYIHYLVTQGIPAGLFYIFACIYTWITGVKDYLKNPKNKEKLVDVAFIIMLIGYFSQALFNSSVTNVAPYKWLLMGLVASRCKQKTLFSIKSRKLDKEK